MNTIFSRREIEDSIKRNFQAKQAMIGPNYTLSQVAEALEKGKDEVSCEYRRCVKLLEVNRAHA